MRISSLLAALCLLAMTAVAALAADPGADFSRTPTTIESDSMRYDQASGTVLFEGKVHVSRTDFQLWSRQLTVYFAPPDKAGKDKAGKDKAGKDKTSAKEKAAAAAVPTEAGKIEKIVARGAVRIEREGKIGTCETATYLALDGVVRMEGNPVLKDGANTVAGKVVKFYFRENRSEVIGDEGQRVQAVFSTPKGDKSPEAPAGAEQ